MKIIFKRFDEDVYEADVLDAPRRTFVKVGRVTFFRNPWNGALGVTYGGDDEGYAGWLTFFAWVGEWSWVDVFGCACHDLAVYVGPFGLEAHIKDPYADTPEFEINNEGHLVLADD